MRGLCNLRPDRELGRETREITPFPSFPLLMSHAVAVQHVLLIFGTGSELRFLGIAAVLHGRFRDTSFEGAWTAVEFTGSRAGASPDSLPAPELPRTASLCGVTPSFLGQR